MIDIFLALTREYEVPRTPHFRSISKIPQTDHFGVIWDYQNRQNGCFLVSGGHKHDQRTETEPLKLNLLTFGDHGLRKKRYRPICKYIGVLSSNKKL